MTKLGKGAAAIFSQAESQTLKEDKTIAEIQPSEVETHKMKDEIDAEALKQAIEEGKKYPKVTVYSPIIAAVMRYREITTPRFKLSPEVEIRLEKALRKEDPKLWAAVEENIRWNKQEMRKHDRRRESNYEPADPPNQPVVHPELRGRRSPSAWPQCQPLMVIPDDCRR
jgi:hypothetical protein